METAEKLQTIKPLSPFNYQEERAAIKTFFSRSLDKEMR